MNAENESEEIGWDVASTKKMMSYSLGFLISARIGGGVSRILFYFYEVEAGLPVAMLGLAFIIFALWNMLNDPFIGYLTDKSFKWSEKWGFRFPWIIFSVGPMLICYLFLYLPPERDPSNPWPLFWYFLIMTCLLDFFFSIYTTHLSAGYTVHFRSDYERRRASAINFIVPGILGFFQGLIFPLVYVYGDKNSVFLAVLITTIINIVWVILLIPGIRESEELKKRFIRGYEEAKRESYWKTMNFAFRRKNFLISLLVFLLWATAWGLYLASGIYFVKDILRMPLSVAVYIGIAAFIGFVGFIPFWTNVAKRLGHVKTMKFGLLLWAIFITPAMWITTLWEAILWSFIGGIAFGGAALMIGPIAADVYDECTAETGKHQEAMFEGIRTFVLRFALIIQAAVFTTVHIFTGYNPDPKALQTPLAQLGIRIHMALIPAILILIAFLIMLKYDLEGEKRESIKRIMKEKGL